MKVLVTGAAGFIGFHVAKRLLERGADVVGLDNLNNYYDVSLKESRLALLMPHRAFEFVRMDLADTEGMAGLFARSHFDRVVNLAAQAGVRYSLINPHAYVNSNVVGFLNVLEGCRHRKVAHLIFASSSSVYGANTRIPFSVHDNVDHPISLYAATKKANELMAHSYAHLYGLPCTGLRFFTVYGPWGRPDMSVFLFTKAIFEGRAIEVFNHGRHKRDFTYIDDIVDGVIRLVDHVPQPDASLTLDQSDPGSSSAPFRLYNIGNHQPVELMSMIRLLEEITGSEAEKIFLPMQPGDVPETYADVEDLTRAVGFTPSTTLESGLRNFVAWYRDYYVC